MRFQKKIVPLQKRIENMSKEELKSYRLTSQEEPTEEMLHAIMEQVAEVARKSSEDAQKEIQRRFEELKLQIQAHRLANAI